MANGYKLKVKTARAKCVRDKRARGRLRVMAHVGLKNVRVQRIKGVQVAGLRVEGIRNKAEQRAGARMGVRVRVQ